MELDLAQFSRFIRDFKANDIIFCEHERGNTFYLIQAGRVKLVKNTVDFERTLDILHPSGMFGEMAILDGSPRSATAIAMDNVKLLEFNAENFEVLMSGNPQIALMLLKIFSKRIYDSKRRFMILTLPSPQAKIADVFLMLDETQPRVNKDYDSREFQATVEDVAHWAGMSIKDTREVLHGFVIQNRLEMYSTNIVVKNINDFARFVNTQRNSSQTSGRRAV